MIRNMDGRDKESCGAVANISELLREICVDGTTSRRAASTSTAGVCVNAFRLPRLRNDDDDDCQPRAAAADTTCKRRPRPADQRRLAYRFAPYCPPRWTASSRGRLSSTTKTDSRERRRHASAVVLDAYNGGAKLELYAELSDMVVLPNVDSKIAAALGAGSRRRHAADGDGFDVDSDTACPSWRRALHGANGSSRCSMEAFRPPAISVDELAAYFEDYFHLPKKMSVMADNMYA